ncbi:C3HC zinc finger-like protein [Artemisia annua]|uniref:C3HC zinc finger-like protein n=1 Tax=Artemisia annua TaxID=35608 RepID=A0A2U1MSQ2_ARTAN|nr:C3HC zinc finger-like protein [Artemisia annua]
MAEESEKRFHAIMDKLFLPPSTSVNNAGGLSRGRNNNNNNTNALALAESKSKGRAVSEMRNAGTCKPWDREELLKRLATFKSMTWFAKPQVVSAIECARRGWVNVDMDIIACESCGARLLFSTPSSWAQEQVEKAALVFSLKLNNGHKLHCPWVDNACDEKLAQFPPTSPLDLVNNYKNRCASLLQLLELPVISSAVIDYMKTPLLEHFLNCPPTLNECEEVLPVLYYQAQKLISLCGWEPRLLPYIVDCKDVQKDALTVYSSHTSDHVIANEGSSTESEEYDHTSVVLECKLCGARVGLWAFSTTPRPAEFVRLIGHAEPNNKNEASSSQTDNTNLQIVESSYAEKGEQTAVVANRNLLSLTIAGGPPPAEQNFRPTISLPVVGQNLRTRFSSAFQSVDSSTSNGSVEEIADANGGHMPLGGDSIMEIAVSGNNKPHTTAAEHSENTNGKLSNCSDTKAMEFDPIKQHRHFCPWITSSGKAAPGWKQTLAALERQKEFVYPSETTQASSSLIEVEDPVGSVRKLLTPPSAKRKKFTHGSS